MTKSFKAIKRFNLLLAVSIIFIFIFSFSLNSAINITQIETTTLSQARGTGSLTLTTGGMSLLAIDNEHGAMPNYISEYKLPTPYNLSGLYFYRSLNLSSIIPDFLNASVNFTKDNFGTLTSYITRNGNHLYLIYAQNYTNTYSGAGNFVRNYVIIHFNMTNFDMSTLNYSDNFVIIGALNVNNGGNGLGSWRPTIRSLYVSDDGSFLSYGGSWYNGVTGATPTFYNINLTIPYMVNQNTFISVGAIGSIVMCFTSPFIFQRTTQQTYGSYYNLWLSPDNSIYAFTERDLQQGIYSLYMSFNGTQMEIKRPFNMEGLTIESTFSNIYLYSQSGGNLYKYLVTNLTIAGDSIPVITAGQETLVSGVINPLLSLFPEPNTLTLGQKLGFVFVFMILTALVLLFAGAQLSRDGMHNLMMYIILLVLVVEFIFFVAIQYIPIGILLTLVLISIAIIWLMTRNRGGG